MAAGGKDCDVPDLMSDSDPDIDEDDDNLAWSDMDDEESDEEMNMLKGNVTCLFCDQIFSSVDSLLSHCRKDHNFDLVGSCRRWTLDCISYIKMINYIRKQKPSTDDVMKILSSRGTEWSSDDYMMASDPNDLMLQFDIEWAESHYQPGLDLPENKDNKSDDHSGQNQHSDSEAIHALVDRIHKTEEQRDFFKEELDRALKDIERLKLTSQHLLMGTTNPNEKESKVKTNGLTLNEEDGYFASYSHHGIHMTMLKDKVRTESYRDFMLKNPHLFEGKTVLDVGCGTGILSMFAVKAGARHVVAVDQSNIIYQAMDIARENKMHEKITFVKGRLEDVTLPIEKFDVIISEWMGYFLLFEAMLDSVVWARDHYLSPGGCVYPDHFAMLVVGVSDPDSRKAKLEFWEDVYGFKMSCMKSSVLDEVHVRLVKKETVVTEAAVIKDIDAMKCKVSDLDFSAEFSLKCQADTDITALVGYFDTDFDSGCHNKISFSTGPRATPTHWEQAVMMLPKPLPVTKGSSVDCKIGYRKHPHDSRGVIITLTVGKQKMKYSLS